LYDGAPGTLYRFDPPNGDVAVVADGIGISNGMGFSPDLKTFYHTDSTVRTIWAYDYNVRTGAVSHKREFVKMPKTEGIPDGMTVDSEGFVWAALWYGGAVVRFDPYGKEERRIRFPVTQTSSVMFGGKDMNELYVTSAWNGTGEPAGGLEPSGYDLRAHRGGELYRVKLDIQGKPEFETDFPTSSRGASRKGE
ncbi:MAG: SMP-30/gluconolactonase/LRE family protein, partial [Chloroflexi bacterium]|nr:SMP-30/gluconolactonase/LRE family protein [Chloroflexota bacterium]